ncbi:MAG: hypothetical protein V4660_07535 [Pseudomonadota bacterium]
MYAKRNADGQLVEVSERVDGDINEFIANDADELQEFLTTTKSKQQLTLERSDQAMARVLEDVISLLVEQGVIRFTDLPDAAQDKLLSRRELRGQRQGMDLLDDGDDLDI